MRSFANRRLIDKLVVVSLSRSQSRSEEHTSELQSQSNLVCRLLLEKKKTVNGTTAQNIIADCAVLTILSTFTVPSKITVTGATSDSSVFQFRSCAARSLPLPIDLP